MRPSIGWGGGESRAQAFVAVGAFSLQIETPLGRDLSAIPACPSKCNAQRGHAVDNWGFAAGMFAMRKLLGITSAIAAVGFVTFASAADLPVYKATPAPVWDWTGMYFGGHVGYGWG